MRSGGWDGEGGVWWGSMTGCASKGGKGPSGRGGRVRSGGRGGEGGVRGAGGCWAVFAAGVGDVEWGRVTGCCRVVWEGWGSW